MRPNYFPEIDLVRGVAVMMMVINHAGHGLMSQAALASPVGHFWIVFGSFAPVLFFLTTGIGAGVQFARGRPASNVAWKVLILVAADAILTVYLRGSIGFDFLAFIGLSTLVCWMLARTRHAVAFSLVGFLVVAGLRFQVGPQLRGNVITDDTQIANVILGVNFVPGISYTLSPWLCFPLLGFCVGWVIAILAERDPMQSRRLYKVLLIPGIILLGVGCLAVWQHAAFERYGTVSASFFTLAMGVLLATLAICGLVENGRGEASRDWLRWLRTRGVACLAIVPIHYLLVDMLQRSGLAGLEAFEFIILMALLVPLCIYLGRAFERVVPVTVAAWPAGVTYILTILIAVTALFLCYKVEIVAVRIWSLFIGQIALCVLFLTVSRQSPARKNGQRVLQAKVSPTGA
jgi:uncharacterized membrane protein